MEIEQKTISDFELEQSIILRDHLLEAAKKFCHDNAIPEYIMILTFMTIGNLAATYLNKDLN